MSERREKKDRIRRRTIVGGRPPAPRQGLRGIPRGIEVLVKKASVDPTFRRVLMQSRAGAAREIELELTPAEMAILDAVPEDQLAAIVENTAVPSPQRRAFLGRAAATMLAAIVGGCIDDGDDPERTPPVVEGIRPDDVTHDVTRDAATRDAATPRPTPLGIRPDDLTRSAGRAYTRAVERAQTRAAATRDAALAPTGIVVEKGIRPTAAPTSTPKPAEKSTQTGQE